MGAFIDRRLMGFELGASGLNFANPTDFLILLQQDITRWFNYPKQIT